MRGALVVGCVVLVACKDGVVLEVRPAPGVVTETVQLFVGLDVCPDCPGIRPPLATPGAQEGDVLPGAVYFREDSGRSVVIREAKVEDGVARFQLEASDVGDSFGLAVAVDINHESAAIVRGLPLDTTGIYRVDLVAADPVLGPKPAGADGNFVAIWQQSPAGVPCMGFEHWNRGTLGDRVFIVPRSDPDCDELPDDRECNALGWNAIGVPPIAETSCTTRAVIDGNAEVCKLGGTSCDATGAEHECAASEYCVPGTYCDPLNDSCNPTLGGDFTTCLFKTASFVRLECKVGFKGSADDATPCRSSVGIDLEPSINVDCLGPYAPLMLGNPELGMPLAFSDAVSYRSISSSRELQAKVRWEYACNYKLELGGSIATAEALADKAFVQVWVGRSGGFVRKLLVPFEITPVPDPQCAFESSCMLVGGDDPLLRCASR